jgi:hypothetical protein
MVRKLRLVTLVGTTLNVPSLMGAIMAMGVLKRSPRCSAQSNGVTRSPQIGAMIAVGGRIIPGSGSFA